MNTLVPKDAYGRILDAIDEGHYPPGTPLVESDLAERFGFSRTPIREALQRLENAGDFAQGGAVAHCLLTGS